MTNRRYRIHHLAEAKEQGHKIVVLTAYDAATAALFDAAGIDILLVGDSIGNTMLGYSSTLPVELDDMERATRAVASGAHHALIIADMPFASYEDSPAHAFASAARLMKAGAHGVKLEGGRRVCEQVSLLSGAGIPVFGHLGYTPQSEHALGGPRVQARDEDAVADLMADAIALEDAGASAIVLELLPATAAERITDALTVPTIGIGAGASCDGQVLVWTDMAGITPNPPRFVRTFGEIGQALTQAAESYASAVRDGSYPDSDHSY
ncbi:MAG: 3-methyl-2-oxobutanoate hydroxymethyltransferase [Micrococcales bacterium]|nr:3-methyl-2-oxobutanoate hydroxymethyltransferase [Micrococcales bacterium]